MAFFAIVIEGKNANAKNNADCVLKLAALVENFCMKHVESMLWVVADETGTTAIDQLIDQHVEELRDKEETRLPQERVTLINLHDRLQQRKTRRMRREFYASATDDQIADLVLKLMDEEIEDEQNAKLS